MTHVLTHTPASKRLLIMAAGTGGHIFPGLAIAHTMMARGWQVSWLGTTTGMEGAIVPKQGIAMDTIAFTGMRGKGWKHAVHGVFRMMMGAIRCFRILGQRRPDVVLGMGGYVTVPGGLMAKLRGIPLILMNADAALLLSNKLLLPCAQQVLFGFPAQFSRAADKARVTGNPVRQEISRLNPPAQRYASRTGPLRVLVMGGSLGAKILNECMPAALARIPVSERPVVVHQSGKAHRQALWQAYQAVHVHAEVVDFIEDVAQRYAQADLVICRAGAITVSELTVAGVASILVPLVVSTTAQQVHNARWMEEHHAAVHLPQTECTPERITEWLQQLTRARCQELAIAAHALGQPRAHDLIAEVLEQA